MHTRLRAAFYTLGCKVNQYETAALERQFAAEGFEIVPPDGEADIYIVNSCTVTAQGDRKSLQVLRRFRRSAPDALLVLCGCLPQAFPDKARGTLADIVAGSKDRGALVELVKQRLAGEGRERLVSIRAHSAGEVFEPLRVNGYASRTRAFVKIQDGCERRCAYCIIPAARGPVRSKPLADIRAELEGLTQAGYREMVLAGINLPAYGCDLGLRLMDAVRAACDVEGVRRVRLGSLEPERLTRGDIRAMAGLGKLCPQFHLSLQSGCDATLKRMRRQYGTGLYRETVRLLREAFPGCAVTTDIMVGFPGETEEEFAQSLAFVGEMGFAQAHVFAFSKRPGTPAADMPGQVPPEEKHARSRRMLARTGADRQAFLHSQCGCEAVVLLEKQLPDGRWEGHTPNYTPVRVKARGVCAGDLVAVAVDGVEDGGCTGTICTR